jgi:hypothetical protein
MGGGVSVSLVQLATSFATLFNNGSQVKPTLIKKKGDDKGHGSDMVVVSPESANLAIEKTMTSLTRIPGSELDRFDIRYVISDVQKPDFKKGGYAKDCYSSILVCGLKHKGDYYTIAMVIDEPHRRDGKWVHDVKPVFEKLMAL